MFSVVSRAGESLFYIRVRPRGSKQRQPVVMHSSSPLISCVAGRVSLIPPDSCHSPSQPTIVDSDTHRLPHQNTAAVENTLSHLHEIASLKYIMPAHSKQQSCFPSCRLVSLTLQVNPVPLFIFFLSGNTERLISTLLFEDKLVMEKLYLFLGSFKHWVLTQPFKNNT